jgi:hypothetical protein
LPIAASLLLSALASQAGPQDALICGFPFGSYLSVGFQPPGITISTGTVSGVRTSPYTGDKLLIQIQGGAEHGNSGGPVVDREGAQIGIPSMGMERALIRWLQPIEHAQELWAHCEKDLLGRKPEASRPARPPEHTVGRIDITGVSVAEEHIETGKTRVTPLKIPASEIVTFLRSDDGSVPDLLEWSPGVLRKISVRDWKEERRLGSSTECSDLT